MCVLISTTPEFTHSIHGFTFIGEIFKVQFTNLQKAQLFQYNSSLHHHRPAVLPDPVLQHASVLVLALADLLQLAGAVPPVVLQVRHRSVHQKARAVAEAAERKVVVQRLHSSRLVEALDVSAALGVLQRAVDVLHHVQVLGDVLQMGNGQ